LVGPSVRRFISAMGWLGWSPIHLGDPFRGFVPSKNWEKFFRRWLFK
jgi:hypothetical protein